MKISKYLFCVLIFTLFTGLILSFTTYYESSTTWNVLERSGSLSQSKDNIIDQKLRETLLNTLEDEQDKTQEEADDKIEEAEDMIDEVEDKIAEAKTIGVSSETIDEAEDKLDGAKEDLVEAKDKLETGDYDEAYEKAESCLNKCEDILDMLEDDEDGENGDDSETGNGDHTKEEAETKIEEAEDKIDELEDKIAEAKSDGVADETIDEAEDELKSANEDLAEAKDELEVERYNEAYEKAESSIEKCKDALDMLEDDGTEDEGTEDDGTEDGEDNDTGNDDETGNESPEQEEILLAVPEAIQAIETPQMIAFTAIGAIAVSNLIMLTNKRFALQFATLVVKIGDAFFAFGTVAYKVGGTLFIAAIGAVLRPPSIRNIKQEEVLNNDTREHIYSYICSHEGAHFREIINHIDIGPFAGIWHLQVLEDFGFIVSRRHGHFKIFYPTGRKIPLQDPRLVLKNKTAKKVFRFILKHPGTYQNEIAKELGKSHGTIRYNLKKLVKAKLVDVITDNGRNKFFINDETLTNFSDLT